MATVDYHDFTTIDTPVEEREALHVGNIWINAAKCGNCGDEIRSKNRHDFVTCSCGSLSVDGGSMYAKRSFGKHSFENIIIPFNDAKEVKSD